MELQRIPSCIVAHSTATDLVNRRTAAFRGAVGREIGCAAQASDRRDVDDRTAARATHQRQRGLHAEKHAVDVHGHLVSPLVEREFVDQAGDGNARIVDEDVEAAFGLLDAGDDGRPFTFAGDIVRHETRLAARLAERSGDVFTPSPEHR